MNIEYRQLLNPDFSPESRVWVYQSSRLFTLDEALVIEELLNSFTAHWMSHGMPVKAAAYLFFGQFIILMADEGASGISGCSTDSSVRLIKEIEQRFSVNMFDRITLAFFVNDKTGSYRVQLLPLSQLQYAIDNGFISSDTLYFNNLVQTKEELEKKWIVPVKESWLLNIISLAKSVS